MPIPKVQTLAAVVAAGVLASLAATSTAVAHEGHAAPEPQAVKKHMKQEKIRVGRGPSNAPAVRNWLTRPRTPARFGPVKHVPGMGRAQYDAGRHVYRVHLGDGSTAETHGVDPAPSAADPLAGGAGTNLPTDETYAPVCTGNSGHRLVLAYARPSGSADHYASSVSTIRSYIKRANTKLVMESVRSSAFGRAAAYKVQCDGSGQYEVLNLTTADATFSKILDAAHASAVGNPTSENAVRYVVFMDSGPSGVSAAGQGETYTADAEYAYSKSSSCTALLNCTTRTAVIYAGYWGTHTLMHEIGHTLGAVQDHGTPHTTLGGHCTDGEDVMCYDDDGANGGLYTTTTCPTSLYANPTYLPFDCGYDDYFNTIEHPFYRATDNVRNVGGKEDDFLSFSPNWPTPSPSVFLEADGDQNVYFRSETGNIRQSRRDASTGTWTTTTLGSFQAADGRVSAVQLADNSIAVFFRGTNGEIYAWWAATSAGPWTLVPLGGAAAGDPTAIRTVSGGINVYYRGSNGAIWEFWSPNGATPYQHGQVGGAPAGNLNVIEQPNGAQNIWYRGTNGAIWEAYWNPANAQWSFGQIGGSALGDPVGVRASNGGQWIYYQDTSGTLSQFWYDGTWHANTLGGTPVGTPTVVRHANGAQNVWFRGANNAVWEYYWNPTSSTWSLGQIGGAATTDPVGIVESNDVSQDIYFQGRAMGLGRLAYSSSTGTWGSTIPCTGPCR